LPTELPTFPLHTSRFQDLETKNAKNGEIPEAMEEIDEGIAPTEQIWPEMAEAGDQGRRPEQGAEEATGWLRAGGENGE
jgi:hypothetical protein